MSIDLKILKTKGKENEDKIFDSALRPQRFEEYIGQTKIKKNLGILIGAAKKRKESIEHILLYGPAGLGKTTLAHLISKETNSNIKITSGPAIERAGDLASILTNLSEGDILFIDEAHRLNKMIEEILYPAMESRKLDIIIGKGPTARILQLNLPSFTLIAATTRVGLLSSPLRSRFGSTFHLEFYDSAEIEQIISRSSKILDIKIEKEAIAYISKSSRLTPRTANRLLKRVRDYAQVKEIETINENAAKEALQLLEIDHLGLESSDRKMLEIIIEKFNGGPVGIKTIATLMNEEEETIEEIYEPYLLQIGFIARTSKGRIITKSAYEYLGKTFNESDQRTFL